jgi:Taurine catabolism dioxygenase TauD, TfdA family
MIKVRLGGGTLGATVEGVLYGIKIPRRNGQSRYTHHWTAGDVLMWDDIGTLHNAQADYSPDEHRLIKRCQVMADRIFDRSFVDTALRGAA